MMNRSDLGRLRACHCITLVVSVQSAVSLVGRWEGVEYYFDNGNKFGDVSMNIYDDGTGLYISGSSQRVLEPQVFDGGDSFLGSVRKDGWCGGERMITCFADDDAATCSFTCDDSNEFYASFSESPPPNGSLISVFGSSVANGYLCSGNCSGESSASDDGGCYQSRLRVYQETNHNRGVFNNANNGDTTTALLDRYYQMLSVNPGFVFFGLSLANEGIMGNDPDAIFQQYEQNMRKLISMAIADGIQPIVGLCYPNLYYSTAEYAYITSMNLKSNAWGVPLVNFLGAVDDGTGRWVKGFYANSGHPNDEGSTEMFYTFVPSLFDAIAAGKPNSPIRMDGSQFILIGGEGDWSAVRYSVKETEIVHPFTVSFRFHLTDTTASTSTLASIIATDGNTGTECSAPVGLSLINTDGSYTVVYTPCNGDGTGLQLGDVVIEPGKWSEVTISHFYANGTTHVYIDGAHTVAVEERVVPSAIELRTEEDSLIAYQDLLIWRSALGPLDVNATVVKSAGVNILQASLEIYAPLDNRLDDSEAVGTNLAQSLTAVELLS